LRGHLKRPLQIEMPRRHVGQFPAIAAERVEFLFVGAMAAIATAVDDAIFSSIHDWAPHRPTVRLIGGRLQVVPDDVV
jgi:hypothetical protein